MLHGLRLLCPLHYALPLTKPLTQRQTVRAWGWVIRWRTPSFRSELEHQVGGVAARVTLAALHCCKSSSQAYLPKAFTSHNMMLITIMRRILSQCDVRCQYANLNVTMWCTLLICNVYCHNATSISKMRCTLSQCNVNCAKKVWHWSYICDIFIVQC